jgi:hypothetical protein
MWPPINEPPQFRQNRHHFQALARQGTTKGTVDPLSN